ncbi:MAG: hypothetical protein ACPGLY_26855, partial [Rubripirellula sp.]
GLIGKRLTGHSTLVTGFSPDDKTWQTQSVMKIDKLAFMVDSAEFPIAAQGYCPLREWQAHGGCMD